MVAVLWLVLAAVLVGILVWFVNRFVLQYVRYRLSQHRYAAIPTGPHVLPFLSATGGNDEMLKAMPRDADGSFLPVVKTGYFVDGRHMVTVTAPEAFRAVLSAPDDEMTKYPPVIDSCGILFGYQTVNSVTGSRHRAQRKLMTPLFHFERLRALSTTFVTYTTHCIDRIKQQLVYSADSDRRQTGPVSMDFAVKLTLHTIISGAFGSDLDVEWMAHRYLEMEEMFFGHISTHMLLGSIVDRAPWLFPNTWRLQRLRHQVGVRLDELIKKRQQQVAAGNPVEGDLLSALVQALNDGQGVLTPTEVVDNCFLFLSAGHGTVAGMIQWFLYFVAVNPEVQAKLHQELDSVLTEEVLAQSDDKVAQCMLEQLPYLSAVNAEVLRMRPPSPMFLRLATKEMEVMGTVIPANTCVALNFYCLHYNAKYWDRPYNFMPERFLKTPQDEAKEGKSRAFAYLPFGAGAHNCLGMNFARKEFMIITGLLAKRFKIELATSKPEDVLAVLKSTVVPNNLHVRFIARE